MSVELELACTAYERRLQNIPEFHEPVVKPSHYKIKLSTLTIQKVIFLKGSKLSKLSTSLIIFLHFTMIYVLEDIGIYCTYTIEILCNSCHCISLPLLV